MWYVCTKILHKIERFNLYEVTCAHPQLGKSNIVDFGMLNELDSLVMYWATHAKFTQGSVLLGIQLGQVCALLCFFKQCNNLLHLLDMDAVFHAGTETKNTC